MATTNATTALADLLTSKLEPTEPADSILAYFREHTGKTFTKRDIKALDKRCPGIEIREHRIAGMTYVAWGGYARNENTPGGALLFSYDSTGRTIDPEFLLKHNPAYFSARDERNAQRLAALKNAYVLGRASDLIAQSWAALDTLKDVAEKLQEFVAYGAELGADTYDIQRMAGIYELDEYVKKQNGGR